METLVLGAVGVVVGVLYLMRRRRRRQLTREAVEGRLRDLRVTGTGATKSDSS